MGEAANKNGKTKKKDKKNVLQKQTAVTAYLKSQQLLLLAFEGYVHNIKTHHYIIFFVRPLHFKPQIKSYC